MLYHVVSCCIMLYHVVSLYLSSCGPEAFATTNQWQKPKMSTQSDAGRNHLLPKLRSTCGWFQDMSSLASVSAWRRQDGKSNDSAWLLDAWGTFIRVAKILQRSRSLQRCGGSNHVSNNKLSKTLPPAPHFCACSVELLASQSNKVGSKMTPMESLGLQGTTFIATRFLDCSSLRRTSVQKETVQQHRKGRMVKKHCRLISICTWDMGRATQVLPGQHLLSMVDDSLAKPRKDLSTYASF